MVGNMPNFHRLVQQRRIQTRSPLSLMVLALTRSTDTLQCGPQMVFCTQLKILGKSGKHLFNRLANLIEWYWTPASRKSPDQFCRPSDISRLLANLIPRATVFSYP